jgi:hypothetical protein
MGDAMIEMLYELFLCRYCNHLHVRSCAINQAIKQEAEVRCVRTCGKSFGCNDPDPENNSFLQFQLKVILENMELQINLKP